MRPRGPELARVDGARVEAREPAGVRVPKAVSIGKAAAFLVGICVDPRRAFEMSERTFEQRRADAATTVGRQDGDADESVPRRRLVVHARRGPGDEVVAVQSGPPAAATL